LGLFAAPYFCLGLKKLGRSVEHTALPIMKTINAATCTGIFGVVLKQLSNQNLRSPVGWNSDVRAKAIGGF